jgi:hypothetical protein
MCSVRHALVDYEQICRDLEDKDDLKGRAVSECENSIRQGALKASKTHNPSDGKVLVQASRRPLSFRPGLVDDGPGPLLGCLWGGRSGEQYARWQRFRGFEGRRCAQCVLVSSPPRLARNNIRYQYALCRLACSPILDGAVSSVEACILQQVTTNTSLSSTER